MVEKWTKIQCANWYLGSIFNLTYFKNILRLSYIVFITLE